jgi:hypothetical protein
MPPPKLVALAKMLDPWPASLGYQGIIADPAAFKDISRSGDAITTALFLNGQSLIGVWRLRFRQRFGLL